MNCQNCGATVSGEFCAECGTKFVGATAVETKVAAKAAPKPALKIVLVLALALGAVGSGLFGFVQSNQATSYASAAVVASQKASEYQDSADTWAGLLESAKSSKETCYYAWWCSTSTYSTWISLVNTDQSYYDDAQASADEWSSKANIARNNQASAENSRNLGFGGAAVFAVALLVVLIVMRRKPQTAVVEPAQE